MTQLFGQYRIVSKTRPNLGVGMRHGFAGAGRSGFTREQLVELSAAALGFYMDDFLMQKRGDERHQEEFVLQGGINDREWVDIKPIIPIAGEDLREPDFGKCMRCNAPLEESEFAIGDVCDGCREAFMEEWEAQQEAAAEEAAEARRYPEVSDDDYYDED